MTTRRIFLKLIAVALSVCPALSKLFPQQFVCDIPWNDKDFDETRMRLTFAFAKAYVLGYSSFRMEATESMLTVVGTDKREPRIDFGKVSFANQGAECPQNPVRFAERFNAYASEMERFGHATYRFSEYAVTSIRIIACRHG